MSRTVRLILATLVSLPSASELAHAGVGVSVGVRLGGPRCYRPVYPVGIYYRPAPVYIAPAPVFVQPVQVVQPLTVVEPVYITPAPAPAPTPLPAPRPVPTVARLQAGDEQPTEVDRNLRALHSPDERTRADAAVQLGRLRVRLAVQPLERLLTTDPSPTVRESSARGLGLIGDAAALNALQRAAQADNDRDVRHSASFAADVLRTNLRGR